MGFVLSPMFFKGTDDVTPSPQLSTTDSHRTICLGIIAALLVLLASSILSLGLCVLILALCMSSDVLVASLIPWTARASGFDRHVGGLTSRRYVDPEEEPDHSSASGVSSLYASCEEQYRFIQSPPNFGQLESHLYSRSPKHHNRLIQLGQVRT